MAGDWIPMRLDLREDPAVITMACALNLDLDAVIGKLHRLWSWANRHLRDGNAPTITRIWMDAHIGVSGWCNAMIASGWMEPNGEGFNLPKYERYNTQSAKARLLNAKRVAAHRAKNGNAPAITDSLPEKRREYVYPPTPQAGGDGASRKQEKSRGKPSSASLTADDLRDNVRVADQARRAASVGACQPGEDGLFHALCCAEHALRVGHNAPALFHTMLFGGKHHKKISGAEEDQARRRLRSHLHGETGPPPSPGS